ncbi:hypothetical protein [Herbaspirillum robiniae]|uniref:hypothetical protein n=1 Tax=Herbaspirillum robiniae TaxID=2014887 RepID=UPI00101AE02E|nr:hypothetical protein [Herbaspirillum robiniae]
MIKFWVTYTRDEQPTTREIQLEVEDRALSCDIVMRALGKFLNPSEQWPFAVDPTDCLDSASLDVRAVRLQRSSGARRYLKITSLSYRPEGTVLQFSC